MARCLTVHPGHTLLDDKEGGLSQGHGAAQLFAEEFLVALQSLRRSSLSRIEITSCRGFFLRIDIIVDMLSYIDVRCLRYRSSMSD